MNYKLFNAVLSMDSYNRGYGSAINLPLKTNGTFLSVGKAQIFTDSTIELGNGNDSSIGFYAIAYDYFGREIIAYRGTDEPLPSIPLFYEAESGSDIWNGWGTGAGSIETKQSAMAFEFYQEVAGNQDPRFANISTTGHSLGGGLAGLVSGTYDKDAVLFNNMPFERALAQTNTATFFSAINPLYNSDLYEHIYGEYGWTDEDLIGIETHYMKGEVLSALRVLSNIPKTSYDMGDIDGLGPIDRHAISSLVIQMFAETEVSENHWQTAAEYFWPILYDDNFARDIGFDTDQLSGGFRTGKEFANILRTTIAYSAIDEGTRVFGDTAIRALYDDANDLGVLLKAHSGAGILSQNTEYLSKILVNFAGQLALNKVEKKGDSDPALQGAFVDIGKDNTNDNIDSLFKIDLTNAHWDQFTNGTTHNIQNFRDDISQTLGIDNIASLYLSAGQENILDMTSGENSDLQNFAYIGSGADDTIKTNIRGAYIDGGFGFDTVDYSNLESGLSIHGDGSVHNWLSTDDPYEMIGSISSIENLILTEFDDYLMPFKYEDDGLTPSNYEYIDGGQGRDRLYVTDNVAIDTRNGHSFIENNLDRFEFNDFEELEDVAQYYVDISIDFSVHLSNFKDLYQRGYFEDKYSVIHYSDKIPFTRIVLDDSVSSLDNNNIFRYYNYLDDDNTYTSDIRFALDYSSVNSSLTFDVRQFENMDSTSLRLATVSGSGIYHSFGDAPAIIGTNHGDTYITHWYSHVRNFYTGTGDDTVTILPARVSGFMIRYSGGHDTYNVSEEIREIVLANTIFMEDVTIASLNGMSGYGGYHALLNIAGHGSISINNVDRATTQISLEAGGRIFIDYNDRVEQWEVIRVGSSSLGTTERDRFIEGDWDNNTWNGRTGWSEKYLGHGGNDVLDGRDGDDIIYGGSGNDNIKGGTGNDTIFGGYDNDTIDGGNGNDKIEGNRGDDIIIGGDGDDIYVFNEGDGSDSISDIGGFDVIQFGEKFSKLDVITDYELDGLYIRFKNNASDVIKILQPDAVEELHFNDGVYFLNDSANDNLIGTDASDEFYGGEGNDILDGAGGSDKLVGGDGDDVLYGGDGDDYGDSSNNWAYQRVDEMPDA